MNLPKPRPESFWKSWLHWPEWLSLVLLTVTLGIPLYSVEAANWLKPQPYLLSVLGLAVAASLFAVKLRLPAVLAFLFGLASGAAVTVWQGSRFLPAHVTENAGFFTLARETWNTLREANPNETSLYFVVFLVFLVWLIAFGSGWGLLKRNNPWVGAILGAVVILVNLSFLTDEYYRYFAYYLLAAGALVSQVALTRQLGPAARSGFRRLPLRKMLFHAVLLLVLGSVVAAGAWFAPVISADTLQSRIREEFAWGKVFNDSPANVFNKLQPVQNTMWNADRKSLTFGAPVDAREDVLFMVSTLKEYSYWRTGRYEVYSSRGWSSSPAVERIPDNGPLDMETPLSNQVKFSYTVTNKVRTDIVLTAGEFVSASRPVLLQPLVDLPEPDAGNISSIVIPYLLNYNDSYTITSAIVQASPAELAQAGQEYPGYITDAYRQLPPISNRVRQLARNITASGPDPYSKVIKVIEFLKRYRYLFEGTAPPNGADAVDDFLFVQQTGNCTNFASAAIVLLRSVGVPARMAAGYLSTEWNPSTYQAVIRARGYHAWPEIYFPGYGWVPFEATPSSNTGPSGSGTTSPQAASPTPSAEPTFTPSPTATSPAPTPTATPTPIPAEGSSAETEGPVPPPAEDGSPQNLTGSGLLAPGLPVLWLLAVTPLVIIPIVVARRRRTRRQDPAAQYYSKMRSYASLAGLAQRPSQTPSEYASELAAAFPAFSRNIQAIAWVYMRSRFARDSQVDYFEIERLRSDWRTLRRALVKRRFLGR